MADSKLRNTDISNGVRFRVHMRDRARFEPGKGGGWYIWDGMRWQRQDPRDTTRVRVLAKEVVRSIDDEVTRAEDDAERKMLRDWAAKSQSTQRINAMVTEAEAEEELHVERKEFDTNPDLVNCLSGTIDIRTGVLKPHDPDDMITHLVPVHYNPNATAPQFLSTVQRAFANDHSGESWQYFLLAMGYALRGHNEEQVAFFTLGDTNTGKTTVLEAANEILGTDYSDATIRTAVLSKNSFGKGAADTDTNKLNGIRYALMTEAVTLDLEEESFKSLTGSGVASLRWLYGERVTVPVTWTFFVAGNEDPKIEKWDPAIGRRIVAFDSGPTVPPEERISGLKRRIVEDEAEGVFATLIAASVRYEQKKLELGGQVFTPQHMPAPVREATMRLEHDGDHLTQFVVDRLEFEPGYEVLKSTAYKSFKATRPNGASAHSAQSFNKAVLAHAQRHGLVYVDSDTRKLYGVRLRPLSVEEMVPSYG